MRGERPGREAHTRESVVALLSNLGSATANDLAGELGISAAGIRRHLDALEAAGEIVEQPASAFGHRGRGRPAKRFVLTAAGRDRLGNSYDQLATDALEELRKVGGEAAVVGFAKSRVRKLLGPIEPRSATEHIDDAAARISDAMRDAGFAAAVRPVGSGVQICRHHCPIADAAEAFPELCDAECEVFAELLDTHVQQLATIANGDQVCCTHIPLAVETPSATSETNDHSAQPGAARKEPA